MGKYNYSCETKENTAQAAGTAVPISTKQSIEICNYIRGNSLERAKRKLSDVVDMKQAVPLRRFNGDAGHKKGMGPGRYPQKASKAILSVIEAAEANAQNKGLSVGNLVVKHICAQLASRPMHPGRQRGREMKRTHIEVVLEEVAQKKEKATKKKVVKKEAPKQEAKAPAPKPEVKKEVPAPKAEEKPEAKEQPKEQVKQETPAQPSQDKPKEAAPEQPAAPKEAQQ